MSAIRCHFDGKVIIPDEPVDLPVNQQFIIRIEPGVVFVDPPGGTPATAKDLIDSGFVGSWADRDDITDSQAFARELRRKAERRGDDT
jgi:hypothetical protein